MSMNWIKLVRSMICHMHKKTGRHKADDILKQQALERLNGEKAGALLVENMMRAKAKLGMGLNIIVFTKQIY